MALITVLIVLIDTLLNKADLGQVTEGQVVSNGRLRLNTCMYLKKRNNKRREFTSPFTAIIVIIIITSN